MKTLKTEVGDIIIKSNGSKWVGQEPDTIEILIEVLKKEPLNVAQFAAYGFINWPDNSNTVRFFGNFKHVSHVFNIEGPEDSPILQELVREINNNIARQFKV